jgi:tyrosine-protein kinase Etk/Wzc
MTTEIPVAEVNEQTNSQADLRNAGRPEKQDHEIAILDILIELAKRKRFIVMTTVAFAVSAAILSFILPPRYKATVTLLPPQQNATTGSAMATQLGGMAALAGTGLGIKNPNDMYVAMFRSRTVEDAMVQHYGLMEEYHQKFMSDASNAFESRVTVDGSGKDGLIHISVEDPDPRRAAQLANGYVDQFRSLSQHLAITEASQRRLFFEQQLEQAKNNLADAEEALKKTEQTTGVIQLDSQAKALIESVASLRAEIASREVQIQGMQTYATGQNAELVQAQQELQSLRTQLSKLGGSEASSPGELLLPKGRVPEAGLEYVRKLRDVKYNETIFDILARQFEIAKLDEAKQGALVQVVDSALPPDRRSFPRRSLFVVVAVVLGFLLSASFVLLQASFRRVRGNPLAREKLSILRRALSI